MNYSKSNIEDRLKNLIEESDISQTESCTSLPCKIFTIFGFLILLGGIPTLIYIWYKWEDSVNNYNKVETDLKEHQENLKNATIECEKQQLIFDSLVEKHNKIKEGIHNYTEKIQDLKNRTNDLNIKMQDVRKGIETNTTQRNNLKTINDQLRTENDKISKELKALEENWKAVNATLNSNYNSRAIWQIVSGLGLFSTIVGASIDTFLHVRESQIKISAIRGEQFALDFNKVASGFEDYTLLSRSKGKDIVRKVCFHNGQKKDLESCNNIKRSLITISTTSGYYFSIYLDIPWTNTEGNHKDANSFIISANHGASAPIRSTSSDNALTIKNGTLMEFGDSKIIISLDGKNGTAKATAYTVPQPYTEDNFLNSKNTFDIIDIKVEEITYT